MIKAQAETLQKDLLVVFDKHDVSVGVGLTKTLEFGVFNWGIAIRSQDERVDALNIGIVSAHE